jgi:hypothetical protein
MKRLLVFTKSADPAIEWRGFSLFPDLKVLDWFTQCYRVATTKKKNHACFLSFTNELHGWRCFEGSFLFLRFFRIFQLLDISFSLCIFKSLQTSYLAKESVHSSPCWSNCNSIEQDSDHLCFICALWHWFVVLVLPF